MTKKDFELIAAVLAAVSNTAHSNAANALRDVADEFARVLGRTNPRFDRERFLKACGVL